MESNESGGGPTRFDYPTSTGRPWEPGTRLFGRFVLLRELGRGGMGIVFAARDEVLAENVALKFVPDFLRWSPTAMEALREEVRQARRLSHANIVRVFELHQDPAAAAVAMECVDGLSLGEVRLRAPSRVLAPGQILKWLPGLARALDYAHREARVVHRDLKPGNLLLRRDGVVKVTDFGLARGLADQISCTQGWHAAGTLAFMSPQQLMGEPCAPSDDIYALGATLYELLTGKPPFHTGHLPTQIENRVPDTISARRKNDDIGGEPVPENWEIAIAACLSKDPAARPTSAGELVACLRGDACCAGVLGRMRRGQRRAKRSRRSRVAALGGLAAGLLAVSAAVHLMLGDGAEADTAPAREQSAEAAAAGSVPLNPAPPGAAERRATYLRGVAAGNLLVHLPLAGDTRDHGGFGWDGVGRNLGEATDRFGRPGEAIEFLGNSSVRVDFPDDILFSVGRPFAVSFWVRTDLQDGLLAQLVGEALLYPYVVLAYGGGRFTAARGGSYLDRERYATPPVARAGEWLYVVWQYNGSELEAYVDAERVLSEPFEADPVLVREWSVTLGGGAPRRRHFVGAMSDFRLYHRDLPLSQIRTNFEIGPHRPRDEEAVLPPEADRFAVTVGIYGERDDLAAAVRAEFGEEAQIADWESIRSLFYDTGAAFADHIGLHINAGALLKRNGRRFFLGDRHFSIQRTEGVFQPGNLYHDYTADMEIWLGSWYNMEFPILVDLGGASGGGLDRHSVRFAGHEADGPPWQATLSGGAAEEDGRLVALPGAAAAARHELPDGHAFSTLRVGFNGGIPHTEWGIELGVRLLCRETGPISVAVGHFPSQPESLRLILGGEASDSHTRLVGARFGEFHFTLLVREGRIHFTAVPLRTAYVLFEETVEIPGLSPANLQAVEWTLAARDPDGPPLWMDEIQLTAR